MWVTAGLGAAAAASVLLGVLALELLIYRVNGLQRADLPGRAEVVFDEAGEYTLYLEGARDSLGRVPVRLEPADGGDPVEFTVLWEPSTFVRGEQHVESVATFTIAGPGSYVLTTRESADPAVTGVAVGPGLGGLIAATALLSTAMTLFFPAATVMGLVMLAHSYWTVKRQAAPPAAPGQPGVRYWDGTRWARRGSDHGTPEDSPR